MTQIELRSKISAFEAERQYARNMAEEAKSEEDREIWETIEGAYTDLVWRLNAFKSKNKQTP